MDYIIQQNVLFQFESKKVLDFPGQESLLFTWSMSINWHLELYAGEIADSPSHCTPQALV